MAKVNKKNILLSKDLQQPTDKAAYLISKITNVSLPIIKSKSVSTIFQYLSYLMNESKKADKHLNWRNNKSAVFDERGDSHSYDLLAKELIKSKYKGPAASKVNFESIKFFSAIKCYNASIQSMNANQSYLSNSSTNFNNSQSLIKYNQGVKTVSDYGTEKFAIGITR